MIRALRLAVFCAAAWFGLSAEVHADALTLIASASPSGTGVVTFSSIPAAYNHLRVILVGRGTQSATVSTVNLTLNNDGGANYNFNRTGTINGTTETNTSSVAQTAMGIGDVVAASSAANYASAIDFLIPMYAATTFNKAVYATEYTPEVNRVNMWIGIWASTAAVNRIDLTLGSGNYVAGTLVQLYGVN